MGPENRKSMIFATSITPKTLPLSESMVMFFVEIVHLLIVSAYNFKTFSNHQTPTQYAPSHVHGLRKCGLDVQEMFTPPVVPEHICQATLPDQRRRVGPTLFERIVVKKNIHTWSVTVCEWPIGEKTGTQKKTGCISMF